MRIIYKLNDDIKLSIIQRFIILKNYSNELRSNQISFQEAKKALKNDIKMYFYLVKKFEKDSIEISASQKVITLIFAS